MQQEGAELEEQFFQLDEYRAKVLEEAQRLSQQKVAQDEKEAELLQSSLDLDDQKEALQAVRTEVEGLQAELTRQQQQLQEREAELQRQYERLRHEQAQLEDVEQAQARRAEELQAREARLEADQRAAQEQQEQLAQRRTAIDAAHAQVRQLQEKQADEQSRLDRLAAELEQQAQQLAAAQEQLEAQRQAWDERALAVAQQEQACTAQQEHLRLRADELTAWQKTLSEQEHEHQVRGAALEERRAALAREEQETRRKLDAEQFELDARAEALERQGADLAEVVEKQRAQAERILQQRRALAEARQHFQHEQQRALERHAQTRADFEALRREAQELLRRLPEADPAAAARIRQMREQLRSSMVGVPVRPGPTPAPADKVSVEEANPVGDALRAWYRHRLSALAASAQRVAAPGELDQLDPADEQLGSLLREQQLIDPDALAALQGEACRQQRPLRQVLLTGGTLSVYQLGLIEAGNLAALLLGPLYVIERLCAGPHETMYRVFDPRRGSEAVLRHLDDTAQADAYRQHFSQAMIESPHLAATLEVLDVHGRPAVLQEWVSGLTAVEWPAQTSVPGVCYRLLLQAAQGLAALHGAGLAHGHLSDAQLVLTGDGLLKICGAGEPPWLRGALAEPAEPRADLHALGHLVTLWYTRRGSRTRPLPETLLGVLNRLAATDETGYRDGSDLLQELEQVGSSIPANAGAWDQLVKHVRAHGTSEAIQRRVA